MVELKPCPFCGEGIVTVYGDYMIQCQICKTIFVQPQSEKPKSMLEVWDRRKEDGK